MSGKNHCSQRDLDNDVERGKQSTVDGSEATQSSLCARSLGVSPLKASRSASKYLDQATRDDRLAHPKNPSRCMRGYDRLFGNRALLPLRSQPRARARSEATSTVRFELQRTGSRSQKDKRSQMKEPGDQSPEGHNNMVADRACSHRRTAWDNTGAGGQASVLKTMRDAIDAR